MKGKFKRLLKSGISSALALSIVATMIQLPAQAEAADVYLPETEIGEDILSNDVFYLTAASAQLHEGANERYLLRLGRGGDCASASGVTIKISDLTAKYGEDYTISVVGSDAEVNNPEDNESLMERMEGEEYTESELVSEEEYLAQLETDDGLYDATVDAVNSAIEYIEDESGVVEDTADDTAAEQESADTEQPADTPNESGAADVGAAEIQDMFIPEIPVLETAGEIDTETADSVPAEGSSETVLNGTEQTESTAEMTEPTESEQLDGQAELVADSTVTEEETGPEAVSESAGMSGQTVETAYGEAVSTDPLQQARSMYTGISGEPQEVTSTTDTFQQIQDMANVITNAVVGATLTVDFAEGESEKYIAIDVIDNGEGDGIRYFYLMLAEPYGTTTNSAASSCAVTILDDEEQAPSVVSFTESSYHAEGDTLTVEIVREGALNTIAEAKLTTVNGSAQAGRDFSPVDMSVVFPMGIDKRTIEIPIRTEYFVGDADFGLKLEPVNGCEIGTESVTVTMTGTAGAADTVVSDDGEVSLMAIEQSARVTDIELGNPIDLSNPAKKGNSDNHYGGTNQYNSSAKEWSMKWKDNYSGWDHFWGAWATGTTGASWTIANRGDVHLAGVQIDWARAGSCANVKVGFVSNTALEWDWGNYPSGGNGDTDLWVYNSRESFGDGTKRNVFSAITNPARVTVLNNGNCKNCDTLWVHSITPIYRPFVVNLQNADPLTFLNADGSYSAWNDATFLALAGANNDTNNQVVRYSKDGKNAVTLQQTVGKNVSTPYTYLKSVRMIKDSYSKTIANYGNDGASSHTITMDANWLHNNSGYIYFEQNNSSDAWKNQTGTFGLRGRIELKPEFGYKDAKIKINVPENNFGYFNVSGDNKKISSSETFTYHRGDIIKLSTVMYDEYKDLYSPAGYMVSYKYNESDTDWVKRDVIVPYSEDGGTSELLDDNERLRYGYYEITPLFTRNDNAIVVRVREDNLWLCDQSYGIFTTPYVEHTEIDGTRYNDYIVYDKPVYGKIYSLTARYGGSARSCDYAFWKEPGSDKTYTGEVFFHEASNDPEENIIELSIEYDYYGDRHLSISGSVYRPSYNMSTRQVGYSNMLPAQGAIVNFGTAFAVVDAEGNFNVPLFRSISDHNHSGDNEHYIRYTIAYNGEESLREMRLSNNPTTYTEHDFTVTDSEGNTSIQTKGVWVNTLNTGQQLINTENGSIINNIEVYSDAVNQGYNLIIDGDSVTLRARCTSPAKYTKQTIDENGVVTEESNADENVTGIEFVIYDAATNTEIASYPAEKQDDEFVANVSLSQALPGNRLYLRVTTDRSTSVYASYDENGNLIQPENDEDMNSTTYADVFTGYTFTQKNTEEVPVLQHVDLPITMDFLELPLVGNTGMSFDFPFVSVGAIKTDTGYRMYIGVSPVQVADKVRGTHAATYAGDTGAYYKDMFSISHPIQSFKDGLAASYQNIFKDVPTLYDGATSALGAPTWRFDVQIGVYFDFTYMQTTNPNNGAVDTHCIFTGVGGYVGVSAGVKMAWYTILPVVFIPAYFGIDISGNVLGFFGAGTDTSKPTITYDAANNATVNFDDSLGEFNASVQLGATVQIYVGVGLAGVLGLRGGGSVSAMGLWEPSDIVSDWGCVLTFKAGIWIDLFLFTVPLQYTLAELKFGSFEEYENMPDVSTSSAELQSVPSFSVRQPYSDEEPVWLPEEIQLMSGFNETSAQTIVENGYEHPDVQLIKLSDGSVFMAFLDSDTTRDALDRTVLKYATYKDGIWSEPVVVQNDDTADFQPSICEMDNGRIMISWLSYDPETQVNEDAADYLSKLEVYTAVIDTASGTVSEETRLTNDEYYDYTPVSVYDDLTGDRAVYYVKTASTGSAEDMVNSYTNDCVVVYMLYSAEQGRWLFDYYYDEEVASEEDKEILISQWHGQRFLSSPIPELGLDVPNISDFTAITYNGIAVYAYTIDQDSSNDTAYDKEMFVQFYDFETHKTYVPVRITDDNVSDALPQFVRTGSGEEADTKLFWYRDEKDVTYIDISSLVSEGVDDNGQITDEYLTGNDGVKRDIDSLYSYVSPNADNYQGSRSMSDFKAVTDGDDIYIVWTQPYTTDEVDENGDAIQCREVYATALIQDENAPGGNADEDVSDDESIPGTSWADPYRLTYTGAFTDEPAAVIDNNGNMMVLYNQYEQEITEDAENPVIISDFKLRASYMEPCGAVDVTDISFSDETPNAGDTVELDISVENTGLTYADGYTVALYEMKDGIQGELIEEIASDIKLLPGNVDGYTIEWTVPEDYEGMSIYAVAQEGGMNNISEYESEKLEKDAVYEISDTITYQDNDGYRISYTVTNTGNTVSTDEDTFRVIFSGPYGMAWDYTLEECDFATVSLEGIGVGESKTFDEALDVKPEMFDKYGFIDCLAVCMNSSDEYLTGGEDIRLMAGKPLELMLNGAEFPETITLNAGETMEFDVTCAPSILNDGLKASFGTEDSSVASFDGTTLKALNAGTTTIYGSVSPYGNETRAIELTVVGEAPEITPDPDGPTPMPEITETPTPTRRPSGGASSGIRITPSPTATPSAAPTAVPEASKTPAPTASARRFSDVAATDWFFDSVEYTAKKGYFNGTGDGIFEPYTNVTRGMLVTVLGRLEGISEEFTDTIYTDVDSNAYYAAHIAWATENGIVDGYGDGLFGPEDLVTREQMAKMTANYLSYKTGVTAEDTSLAYTDADDISEWAAEAVALAAQQGIMNGNADGTFAPKSFATRAETAAVIERLDRLIASQE